MRVLVFSTLYPNATTPEHGVFVAERLQQLLLVGGIQAHVVAPVPWFPFRNGVLGRYAGLASVPRSESTGGVRVDHPRYLVIPKIGMYATPWLLARAARRTLAQIRESGFDFDVIDAHYYYPDGVAAAMLGRWFRRPVVITARGSDINVIGTRPLARRMMRWAHRVSAATVAVSRALADAMIRFGMDAARLTVLRNGVDLQKFHPCDRVAARQKLGWQSRTLLMVGRLDAAKGHELAIESLKELPPDHVLVVIGDGPQRAALERRAERLGVVSRVSFSGSRPHRELALYYGAADVLLLPSEREGMPNVLLESLACGTPVVASDVGGVREIVSVPEAGVVLRERTPAAIAQACISLFASYPDRERVRRHAETFGWRPTSEAQAKLLRQVIRAAT